LLTFFNSTNIIFFILLSTGLGLILEGLLSKFIHRSTGEHLWIYTRYKLFAGGTSWLIIPLWSGAATLAIIIKMVLG